MQTLSTINSLESYKCHTHQTLVIHGAGFVDKAMLSHIELPIPNRSRSSPLFSNDTAHATTKIMLKPAVASLGLQNE
jgi:hypothetical protein